MTRLEREILYHAINGLWSGIPICCVAYFCAKRLEGSGLIGHEADKRRGHDDTNYVRCDTCFAENRRVELLYNGIICRELMQ